MWHATVVDDRVYDWHARLLLVSISMLSLLLARRKHPSLTVRDGNVRGGVTCHVKAGKGVLF